MNQSIRVAIVVFVAALALSAGALLFGEESVELSSVPDAVKSAAIEALPGFVIQAAELERGTSGVVYELEGVADGKRYEIELMEDGRVLGIELEDDEDVALADVPEAVLNAAMAAVPGIELSEAEVERGPSGAVYELEGTADGKLHEIAVTSDGEVLGIEDEDDSSDDTSGDSSDDASSDSSDDAT